MDLKNLPDKEQLQFKEKAFLMDVHEQFSHTSKIWYYVLAAIIILSIPGVLILKGQLASHYIRNLPILDINPNAIHPQDLKTAGMDFFPVGSTGFYSVYARVFNPNADVSARAFYYEFVFKNQSGSVLKKISGDDFLLRGASKFIVVPAVELSEKPTAVDFSMSDPRWTRAVADFKPQFDILQKQWGDSDGKFFVSALVKNQNSFSVKKVSVPVVVFAEDNKTVLAVNQTVLDDVQPFESRYFLVSWPSDKQGLFPAAIGQIEVGTEINPLGATFR